MRLRKDTLSISGYFAAFLGLGVTAAALGPTLPSLAAVASVSLAQIGLILMVRAFGEMAGCLLASPAIDRGHGRAVLVGSVLVMAVCLSVIPLSSSLMAFLGTFIVLGAAQGALHTGTNTLLSWKHPDRVHSLISTLHFSFGVGAIAAPLIVAWLLPFREDGLLVYWFLAAVLAPLGVLLAISPKPEARVAPSAVQKSTASRSAFYWAPVMLFFYVGAEATLGSWLFVYAERAVNFSAATAAYLVATFWGAFTFGRLLSIVGSSFIPSSQYVLASMIAGILSALGLLCLSQSGAVLWISIAALGLSMSAVFPQGFAFVSTALGMTGRQIAWLLISGSFGGMLLPWLTGLMLESVSPHTMPVVALSAMSCALIAFLMVRRASQQGQASTSL
jgi:MFS transporter, FHS family, Na+ dependent glucose transporter 1